MDFVWFWTFWHWSTEGFRSGALLRSPLQGIASHWDEWHRHEASEIERREIDRLGSSVFDQRRFICWLARRWAREARWRDELLPGRFVLAHLSRIAPFDSWTAFEKYRTTYAAPGIAAIVLDEESAGEFNDVRRVEAVALPRDEDAAASAVVCDGFQADTGELNTARRAAMSLLNGQGLLVFLGLWLLAGARPYSRIVRTILAVAWIAVIALIIRLLIGADPGPRLVVLVAILFAVWAGLVITAISVAVRLGFSAWRSGRELKRSMEQQQIHLRISDGLSVQGGSAGLAFCLNELLATYRSQPHSTHRSWLWERFFRRLRTSSHNWAATGIIASNATIEDVVLEPKIRACLRNPTITDVLTPWQAEAKQRSVEKVATFARTSDRGRPTVTGMTLGFATTQKKLRTHRCRHAAQSIIAVGDFASKSQLATNAIAVAVSLVMLVALPDIRNVLQPPPPPKVVAPGSPSPYFLWVSLATNRPNAFNALLESGFWSNRRAEVVEYGGADGSMRAEMRLSRSGHQSTIDEQDGIVWIERRRKFLTREFQAGDRIASYPFAHLNGLRHE